jgi:hypothetical protein
MDDSERTGPSLSELTAFQPNGSRGAVYCRHCGGKIIALLWGSKFQSYMHSGAANCNRIPEPTGSMHWVPGKSVHDGSGKLLEHDPQIGMHRIGATNHDAPVRPYGPAKPVVPSDVLHNPQGGKNHAG